MVQCAILDAEGKEDEEEVVVEEEEDTNARTDACTTCTCVCGEGSREFYASCVSSAKSSACGGTRAYESLEVRIACGS